MTKKHASAKWQGNLKNGEGIINFETDYPTEAGYSAGSRFGLARGNSPEELIAAAHAACFSMALAHLLSEEELVPQQVATTATVSIEEDGDGFSITRSDLETQVNALGLDAAKLRAYAEIARVNCPVSKALANVEITVESVLKNSLEPNDD